MAGEFHDYTDIPDRKKTKAELRREMELTVLLSQQRIEMNKTMNEMTLIPTEWRAIEGMFPCKPRGQKVTLRLDADVAKIPRHGHGLARAGQRDFARVDAGAAGEGDRGGGRRGLAGAAVVI